MHQPEEFVISGKEDHACLLKKSLYVMKQFTKQWYKQFNTFILEHDFSWSPYDGCVYFRQLTDGFFMYWLIYVDGILIVAKDMSEINKLKAQLSGEFDMKYLWLAKKILSMEIRKDKKEGKLYLS